MGLTPCRGVKCWWDHTQGTGLDLNLNYNLISGQHIPWFESLCPLCVPFPDWKLNFEAFFAPSSGASPAGPFPNPKSLPARHCWGWAGCVQGSSLPLPYSSLLFVSPSRLGTPEQGGGRLAPAAGGGCGSRRAAAGVSAVPGGGAARDISSKKLCTPRISPCTALQKPFLGAALILILPIGYGWLRSSESPKSADGEGAPLGRERAAVSLGFTPSSCAPISCCKLLQGQGGEMVEIAGVCAIRCHFPLARGGPGEAAVPPRYFYQKPGAVSCSQLPFSGKGAIVRQSY